jgi:hypothetical protein
MTRKTKRLLLAVVAFVGALAAFIGNAEKIYLALAQWLSAETTIEVTLAAPADRRVKVGIFRGDKTFAVAEIEGGKTVALTVPANERYFVTWQGFGFKPAKTEEILVTREALRSRLESKSKDADGELLTLRLEQGRSTPKTSAPSAASLLATASTGAAARPTSASLVPEIDRAMFIVGLFEVGTTDCGTRVVVLTRQAIFGCIGMTLPGHIARVVKDVREPLQFINKIAGDDAGFVWSLVQTNGLFSKELETHPDKTKLTRRLEALSRTPEFRMKYQEFVFMWYRQALQVAEQLQLRSERGVLLVFDASVQFGPGRVLALRDSYEARVKGQARLDERGRISVLGELIKERYAKFPLVATRVDTIVGGRRTFKGIEYDLQGLGIADNVPMRGLELN